MFPSKSGAASTAAIMALTAVLALTGLIDNAQARPIFMKYDGVDGSVTPVPGGQRALSRPDGKVCCAVERKTAPAFLKPSECRKLKGAVVPRPKCAQAAKPSDAYFVKVDRETTTQTRKPGTASGAASVRPH